MGYLGSQEHIANAKRCRALGVEVVKKNAQKRRESYLLTPSTCTTCKTALPYEKRKNRFCSSSCAASYNNSKREAPSEEVKKKISDKLKGRQSKNKGVKKLGDNCLITYLTCNVCRTSFLGRNGRTRKTCSRECMISKVQSRTYRNGSRKTILYRGVILESSWELKVAEELDRLDIQWERPTSIPWEDRKGVLRLYYPDFYLPQHGLYLDPKNEHCMVIGKDKMEKISNKVKIVYGSLKLILDTIYNLKIK